MTVLHEMDQLRMLEEQVPSPDPAPVRPIFLSQSGQVLLAVPPLGQSQMFSQVAFSRFGANCTTDLAEAFAQVP